MSKRVNDDTEDHIQDNGSDDQEVRQVKEELYDEIGAVPFLHRCGHEFSDTTSQSQTVIQRAEVTMDQGHAHTRASFIYQTFVNRGIKIIIC